MHRTTLDSLRRNGKLEFGDGYRTKRAEHGSPGFRILRVADVMDGAIKPDGSDFVREEYRRAVGPKLSHPGDVLLTTKGTVGRVAIYPETAEQVVYSPQLCYFRITDQEFLDGRFLAYWFKSGAFIKQAGHRANNTDMAAYINLRDIGSLTIDLPEVAEQRAIADVLGALDDKITSNTAVVALADQLATAMTASALDGSATPLSELANLTMGSSPPGSSYNETGDGTPFYQGVRDFGTRSPSRRVWTTSPVRLARADDTLISVRAPVGRVNLAAGDLCLGRGLAGARSRTGTPMTLFHQIRAAQDEWAPFEAVGTVFGAITKAQLESVAIPSIKESRREALESELATLESEIGVALNESELLAATRDQLLPLLMTGKVRVRGA
jgi:type I restriction enzyme S subunit